MAVLALIVALALLLHNGALQRWRDQPPAAAAPAAAETALAHAARHADPRYVCPMHSQVIEEQPGTCPICGMALVPVEDSTRRPDNAAETAAGQLPTVSLRPEIVNSLGVRTAAVERSPLPYRINASGYVAYDDSRVHKLRAGASATVTRLTVAVGDSVQKGDVLMHLASPEVRDAEEAYLWNLERGNQAARSEARAELERLGVPAEEIDRLDAERTASAEFPWMAAAAGTVTKLAVEEGAEIGPGTELATLIDTGRVWVSVDVLERDSSWMRLELPVEVRVPTLPGRAWEGVVDFLHPALDPVTRSLRTRISVDNHDRSLRPNMFAKVEILVPSDTAVLHVPREAIIREARQSRVILALGDGRFMPRVVKTGMESEGRTEILEGLDQGEVVVVSAQFLIDSEASLQASLQRLQTTTP